jgi:hypothetical protein
MHTFRSDRERRGLSVIDPDRSRGQRPNSDFDLQLSIVFIGDFARCKPFDAASFDQQIVNSKQSALFHHLGDVARNDDGWAAVFFAIEEIEVESSDR